MDAVSSLETALGAELLRADMLGATRPRMAGRYVVQAFVGRGATGLVVAARDETLSREVALKLTPLGADDSIADEARALARLDHPNVVPVYDAVALDVMLGAEPHRLWAVSMPLVDGMTMRAWLRERPRSPREIVSVMRQAGAGLAAAHARRIVHRDFKPENVLIRSDGVVQVIDFGFAVAQRSSVGLPPMPIAGTVPYLAPEAREGLATPRSDQFAFGITLVEALTGDPTPPGRTAPPGVPRDLWRIARRASHPDAQRRYASMDALLAELARARLTPRQSAWWVFPALALVVGTWLFSSPSRQAPTRRCEEIAGDWQLDTRVDAVTSGTVPRGTTGRYHLALRHVARCEFDAELAQLEDQRPGQRVHHYATAPIRVRGRFTGTVSPTSGAIVLSLAQGARTYDLAFPSASAGAGRFAAQGFVGRVTSVSRWAPVIGHDHRRVP